MLEVYVESVNIYFVGNEQSFRLILLNKIKFKIAPDVYFAIPYKSFEMVIFQGYYRRWVRAY